MRSRSFPHQKPNWSRFRNQGAPANIVGPDRARRNAFLLSDTRYSRPEFANLNRTDGVKVMRPSYLRSKRISRVCGLSDGDPGSAV